MRSSKLAFICLAVAIFALTTCSAKYNQNNKHSGVFKLIKDTVESNNKLGDDIYDNIDLMISSFIKGTGADIVVNNTYEWVNATRDFARSIDKSVQDFISKGVNMDTYISLTQHIGNAQPMIKYCFNSSYDGYKDAASHLSTFSNPKEYFTKMGLKVAYSFFDWYRIYNSMVEAVKKQNMAQVSFLSGQIVKTMLNFNSKLNQTDLTAGQFNADSVVESIFEFFYGLVDGAIFSHSAKIQVCENKTTEYSGRFQDAMTEFKKHTEEGLYNGVEAVSDLFGLFYMLNVGCYGAYNAVHFFTKNLSK